MKSIIVGALGIIFSFTAFCSPTNVELGQTVSIKLTSSKSICNIRVMGDGIIEDIAATAGEDVYFTYTPKETGLKRFVWEGKLKARGLKTLFPCFDSGNFEVTVVKNAEMLRTEAAEKEALLEQLKADIEKKLKADIQAEQTAKIKAEEDRKAAELRIKEEREQAAKMAAEKEKREKLEKFIESAAGQKLLAEMKANDERDRLAAEREEEARLAANAKKVIAEKLAAEKEEEARSAQQDEVAKEEEARLARLDETAKEEEERQAKIAAAERLAAEQQRQQKIQDAKREKEILDKLTIENENKKRELAELRSELSALVNGVPKKPNNDLSKSRWVEEKIFGKKWQLFEGIPCNMNGGTYKVFDLKDSDIEKIYLKGIERPKGRQKGEAQLIVQDGNKFTIRQKLWTDGNQNMVRLVGNGVLVSDRIAMYELLNFDTLKYEFTTTMIDVNAALQRPSQIKYQAGTKEIGSIRLCN
jgi:colicin import membrane protein